MADHALIPFGVILAAAEGGAGGVENLSLLTTIAAGFAAAWVLGLVTERLGLSPIVGYLLAGVVIGEHTPGYSGDPHIAHQLAEVGVILLMFGVGLHFQLKDLSAVKRVAIPGAVGQSVVATLATVGMFVLFGWSVKSAVVLGMATAVASTVVLLRVLMDRDMLNTSHGHIAVGWLIVEDIFTVLALVFVPLLGADPSVVAAATGAAAETVGATAEAAKQAAGLVSDRPSALVTIGWAIAKLAALVAIVLFAGSKVVPWVLNQVAKLRSPELFTLTVLVMSITIAVGSAVFFGASVALGAFLAGMVVAQSPVSHQAAADALPMRDAFAVLFFVSVGMLVDPSIIIDEPLMVAAGLVVVLVVKPLTALAIVAVLGYPARTALTVAIGLAQIGEFSFILAQVATNHRIIPEVGVQILVVTAMISITINPLLFRSIDRIESALRARPALWRLLNARADKRAAEINAPSHAAVATEEKPLAVIVGYGPVGRLVDAMLRDAGMQTVIVDMNIDTISGLTRSGRLAIFGDGSRREVLEQAGVAKAVHVVCTLSHSGGRVPLVMAVRDINPNAEITVRARYLTEHEALAGAGATAVVLEEGEAGIALARHVLEGRKVDHATITKVLSAVRTVWKMD